MENDKNDKDKNLNDATQKKVDEATEKIVNAEDLKIKWREELENNPAVHNYFKGFYGNAMEDFLKSYIQNKYLYYTYGDFYGQKNETKGEYWIHQAHENLKPILQKKLFDMQCLWRAEQLNIQGIETAFDFKIWEYEIMNCQFLDPITTDEIALYQSFLLQIDDFDSNYDFYDWQNYDEIKAAQESDGDDIDDMPDWYEFHNTRTGKSSLLLLPDTRGTKENFYLDLVREKSRIESEKNKPEAESDTRPFISPFDKETVSTFIKKFEDAETQKNYKNYIKGSAHLRFENSTFRSIVSAIFDAGENIPIASHHNAMEAIEKAYSNYCAKKTAEYMPIAHEQYLFNLKMGFMHKNEMENYFIKFATNVKDMILEGRELNGEAKDLDF